MDKREHIAGIASLIIFALVAGIVGALAIHMIESIYDPRAAGWPAIAGWGIWGVFVLRFLWKKVE